jgi:hypothetical protein
MNGSVSPPSVGKARVSFSLSFFLSFIPFDPSDPWFKKSVPIAATPFVSFVLFVVLHTSTLITPGTTNQKDDSDEVKLQPLDPFANFFFVVLVFFVVKKNFYGPLRKPLR